ncbi:hypothetical protein GOV14_04155, partial [Candidatus Pacearchaeota archaeon]|nr:hypothetical protein [Candidatus Pacearchaeota archaeon]
MEKRRRYLGLLLLVLVLFLVAAGIRDVSAVVSETEPGIEWFSSETGEHYSSELAADAADKAAAAGGTLREPREPNENLVLWKEKLQGIPIIGVLLSNNYEGYEDVSVIAEFSKVLFLFLIILLIYSGLSYVKFPESGAVRWLLAFIVGILATILITTEELIAALQSYKAMGIVLTLFFPMLVLMFFTFVVSSRINAFGIVMQRIMWIIYSVFLFLKAGSMLLIKIGLTAGGYKTVAESGKWIEHSWFTIKGTNNPTFLRKAVEFFMGDLEAAIASAADATILVILVVVSIAVYYFFVVRNEGLTAWLAEAKRKADLEAFKDN